MAATNRDSARDGCSAGQFREDLFHYRIGVVTIELPPLRARREDVTLIANAMLVQFRSRHPEHAPKTFGREALDRLTALQWPGNVRELRNLVERAA